MPAVTAIKVECVPIVLAHRAFIGWQYISGTLLSEIWLQELQVFAMAVSDGPADCV
jgi:hypothetical protein